MDKKCKDCGAIKKISDFYGVQGECKECTKNRVKKRYHDPEVHERIMLYERKRARTPERKKYATEIYLKRKKEFPLEWRARYVLNKDLRLGRIKKYPCAECGDIKSEAHHIDYNKPLEVVWLCRKHHSIIHKK